MPCPQITHMENSPRPHLFGLLAGLFLAVGISFASIVLARTWTHLKESQVIDVTGSAQKHIRSDLAIWQGHFAVSDESLLTANAQLKAGLAKLETFLRLKGVKDYALMPVQIREITQRVKDENDEVVTKRIGYQLTQGVEVRSSDVESTPRLSRECTELLEQGVAMISDSVQFIYTQAGHAKVEMMAEATKNARERADQIARQGNRQVKELRSARMGVVQINPLYSTATSWEGNNDNSTLDKTITVTVSAEFALQ